MSTSRTTAPLAMACTTTPKLSSMSFGLGTVVGWTRFVTRFSSLLSILFTFTDQPSSAAITDGGRCTDAETCGSTTYVAYLRFALSCYSHCVVSISPAVVYFPSGCVMYGLSARLQQIHLPLRQQNLLGHEIYHDLLLHPTHR